jgi:hypothetical protein
MREGLTVDFDALAIEYGATQAKRGIAATADTNPDAEAKNRQTAQVLHAPVSAVRTLPQEYERRQKIESIDYDALAADAPRTSAFIANPEDAAVASDDVPNLAEIEKRFGTLRAPEAPQSSLGSVLRGLASGFDTGLELTRQGVNQQFADLVGNAPYSREAQREAEAARFRQSLLDPQFDSSTGEALYGAGRSLLQLAPALAASVALRSPSVALGAAGLQTEADAYTKYRARGAAPSTALLAASGEGAVEVATEFLPMGFLAERLGKAGGTEFVKKYLLPDLAGEQAATFLQDAIDTGVANPDKTWGDFLAERPEAAYQTAVSSLALSGLFGGVNAAARRFSAKEEQASEAVQLGDAMEQIGAIPSKLKERDPETFRKFAETAAEGGQAQSVFLDRDGFAQSGIDPAALAEILPEKAEEIARALAGDGDVEISVADYAARVAGTDIGAALADHVRFDPLGLSRAEGREFMQGGAAEFDREAEAALAEAESEIAFETSRDKVRADIETRMNALGRFGKDANAKYAQLTATVYGAWADKYGVSPEEFYAANPVDVGAELPGGAATFTQEAQLKTDTPEFATWFDLSAVYDEKNDKPLVVYHATDADISQFDRKRLAPKGKYGRDAEGKNARFTSKLGFWFSEKNNIASRTGNNATMPVYLSIQNPYTVHLEELFQERENYQGKPEDFINDLMGKGYDGLNVIDSEFGGTSWVAFRPEQIKSVFNRGTFDPNDSRILYQGDETQRGFFNPDRNLIGLLQNADYSTFLHESGHFYLETMARLAAQDGAPQGIKDDMQKLLDWFGVPDLATWQGMDMDAQREHHEKFARGFEAYLFEGKAPSRELRSLFRTFAAWLKSVYKTMRSLNVELTDEVRGVMDRLLATEAQIKEAEAQRAFVPLFKNIDESQMTPEEFAAYTKLDGDATLQAAEELQRRSVADMKWLSNAKSRYIKELQKEAEGKRAAIREEVRKEIEAEPIEQARRFIRKGEIAGTDTVAETHKLNTGVLKELYGEGDDAPYKRLKGMTSPNGLHPDQLAEDFGFSSGDELVKELLIAEPAASRIARETDRRILERYGGMPDAESLERAADEAIHNKARARFLAREAAALEKATGKARLLNEAARQYAAQKVGRTKIKDLKPARYEAQEERAGRKSREAFRKGEIETAAAEKRAQLLNNHVARESLAARAYVEKAVKYFKRFDKRAILKRVDGDYVEQIRQLLERYDLRSSVSNKDIERRKSFAAWYAAQLAEGKKPDVPDYLLNDANRQSYKELTTDELVGLYETVKQVEHLGRLKNKLLTAAKQRDYDTAVEEMTARVYESGKGRKADNRTRAAGTTGRLLDGFFGSHRKFASLIRELDGWQDGGPVWEYFGRTANERGDLEAEMRADATERLGALIRPLLAQGKMGGKGQFFSSLGISLNREERIGIALNAGNAGNLQRLLGGEGWTTEQIRPVLDSLTAEEARAVQAIWDFFESYRPLIGAKEKRVYGVEPDWVEPQPIEIGKTQLRGGYFPIKYDPRRNQDSSEHSAAEEADRQMSASYTAATTRRSFTKARAEEVSGRPLLYTMDGLFQGINDVIHDLAWHEWLIDVNKFMRSRRLDTAVRGTYGAERVQQMKKAIEDIARGDAPETDALEKVVAHLRHGSVTAAMGFNIVNAVINVTGLTQSFYRIGGKWALKGIGEFAANPRGLLEEIHEKSAFMRTRQKTFTREVNEIRSLIRGKTKAREGLERLMFLPMYATQTLVDAPTWKGAYLKAANEGHDESMAVALADQAVIDAQGSGQIKDLAAIQRGSGYKKLFTAFYGYFSTTYNLTVEATKKTDFKDPMDVMRLGGDYLILYALPAALGTILKAALTPGDDFDDPEELAKKLASDQLSYAFATMVGLREAVGFAQRLAGVKEYGFAYSGPAGLRFLSAFDRLGEQLSQGEADAALRRSALGTTGILLHLPSGQANRTIDGMTAIMDGKTNNPLAVVAGAPKR